MAAIAVLNTLSALSMPVADRRPALPVVLVWLALMSLHALVYLFGDRIRKRFDLSGYAAAQAALLFGIAVSNAPGPVTVALFMAAVSELVVLAASRWGTLRITLGAIGLFVLAALITSGVYRATTAGLMLAATGLIAHAIAALLRRAVTAGPREAAVPINSAVSLSGREIEILRELVGGTRNGAIAEKLGIAERTVKAHLENIYLKLGVDSRAGAVAAALQRRLV
ncbi:MAG TPA: LuxR C-terminal-related transcriptional regulator [Gemmatimonadales bacterium]|nr:LuxR C-terminal-related transcriptional regulator [Gemmatimonadales bacterium]